MNNKSNNQGRSHRHAVYQKFRWRSVFIALMVALVLGSASQMPPAQAAPANTTEIRFFMLALKEGAISTYVCVGELVTLQALVYRQKRIDGVSETLEPVTGVTLLGEVDNPDIGKISPDYNTTNWGGSIYPGAADFMFQAERPGTATIKFSGKVREPGWFGTDFRAGEFQPVSAQVDVRVVPCRFKVKGASLWDSGGMVSLLALLDGEIKLNDQGHFTGTTTVNWDAFFTIPDGNAACGGTRSVSATDSQADLIGNMSDSGQVTMNITYQPTTFSMSGSCSPGGGSGEETMTPTPLVITVASSGGVSTQPQVLNGISGSATIIVIPLEDEPVAFNADNRTALSLPAWWAMLWDNFPPLFSALLAMR